MTYATRSSRSGRLDAPTTHAVSRGGQAATVVDRSAQGQKLSGLAQLMRDGPVAVAQRRQLQALFGGAVQRAAAHEDDELQMKRAVQRATDEDEDVLQGKFAPAQRREEAAAKSNETGLPDQLKTGIESLSGMSLDNVRVHYNSSQPAQLNALAYAQGSDIHVAPGQEQHLPHEAWHVVQQAQGRVKPTMQMKDGVPVNDDVGLEREADVMGAKALMPGAQRSATPDASPVVDDRLETVAQTRQFDGRSDDAASIHSNSGKTSHNPQVVQRVQIGGVEVNKKTNMPSWPWNDGHSYHINLTTDTSHVSREGIPMIHFFFKDSGDDITDEQPSKKERGGKSKKRVKGIKGKVKTKRVFSALPDDLQTYIKTNWAALVG